MEVIIFAFCSPYTSTLRLAVLSYRSDNCPWVGDGSKRNPVHNVGKPGKANGEGLAIKCGGLNEDTHLPGPCWKVKLV
jgi:hypothetical protein